ncbi:hypothetical protein NDU88_000939 [Pleurodeles waltl]|uniref:Uncharacterized protein n=1 Tax=Pleurodeles waltl TaxID=8319 RepID=A0AAV7LXS6_PLEWA|nr:hypothetical protein NDU88_000939 [Pleurodeles waltl]
MKLLEEAGRLDLLAASTLIEARPSRRAAAWVAAAVIACSLPCPKFRTRDQVTTPRTKNDSAELGAARYHQEEEKMRPRVAGWTNEGQ